MTSDADRGAPWSLADETRRRLSLHSPSSPQERSKDRGRVQAHHSDGSAKADRDAAEAEDELTQGAGPADAGSTTPAADTQCDRRRSRRLGFRQGGSSGSAGSVGSRRDLRVSTAQPLPIAMACANGDPASTRPRDVGLGSRPCEKSMPGPLGRIFRHSRVSGNPEISITCAGPTLCGGDEIRQMAGFSHGLGREPPPADGTKRLISSVSLPNAQADAVAH